MTLAAALLPAAREFDHVVDSCDDLDEYMKGTILVRRSIVCQEMKVSEEGWRASATLTVCDLINLFRPLPSMTGWPLSFMRIAFHYYSTYHGIGEESPSIL